MELHQLRYFVAVMDTGSFGKAAVRCAVAQPSLSQQVIKLEKELGKPLFDRLGRSIAVTEAGRLLYPRAKRILTEVENARTSVAEDVEAGLGKLMVGAIPTVAPYLLPDAIAAFRQAWPNAELSITEDITRNLVRMLIDSEIDLAIMAAPIEDHRLAVEQIAHEPLVCVVDKGHPLGGRKRVRFDELTDQPSIVLHEVHCLSQQVNAFCVDRGVQPRIVCHAAQLSTLLRLVDLGLGLSLVPQTAVASYAGQLKVVPLVGPPMLRRLVVVWNASRHRPHLGTRFIEQLRATAAASPDLEAIAPA
ncbi:MAG: LysR family transcriptional regulator [Phycisphaeraceae bacterium]